MSAIINMRARIAQAVAKIATNIDASVEPVTNEFGEMAIASYNWLARYLGISEVNPLSQQYTEQELAAAAAILVAGGPWYYPSSAGMAMGGYKDLGSEFTITTGATAADTISISLEVSDDTTNPPAAGSWQNISPSGSDLITAAPPPGPTSWISTSPGGGGATSLTKVIDWDNLNVRRFRFVLAAAGHDAVLTRLHIRLKAL